MKNLSTLFSVKVKFPAAFLISIIITTVFQGTVSARLLDTLIIEGLNINSPRVVRNAIPLREHMPFSASEVQESIRNLYDLGIFDTIDVYILQENDSAASLKMVISEFPICDTIEYHGNKKLKKKDLEEKCSLRHGQILSKSALFDEEMRIRALYAEKGYNLAVVKSELISTKTPGYSIVKQSITEGPRVRIKTITFHGNSEVKSKKLARVLKTKESRWWRSGDFKRELYREHLDTLIMYYNDQGYLDASIVNDSVWYTDSSKNIAIDITIDEGKKYYTGGFYFKGNNIIPTDSLTSKIALKYGKPFSKTRFEMSKYLVENTYREEGYLWVHVTDERSFRNDTIDVTFEIYEGRSAVVRKVDVKGNTKTMEKVVRREIDLLPGKKYKQSQMMRSRQKVMALNFFSDVRPDLVPNDDGTIDLMFDITEKDNIGQLQIGAAYSQINSFIGTFSTSIPNFRGTGQDLSVNIQYGEEQQDIMLSYTEPWAFDRPISLSGSVFFRNNSYTNYYANKQWGFILGSGLSKMTWPDDHFRIDGSYQFSYEEGLEPVVSEVPARNLVIDKSGFLSRVSFAITRYDLDMPMFPTEGSKLTFSPQVAGLGGSYRYLKNTLGYEMYFPLPYKLVFGSRTKMGLISSLNGHHISISQYDLFKLGGVYISDADLRGYKEGMLGGLSGLAGSSSRDYFHPENGLAMFSTTFELRYPLLEQQLYIGAFTDGGNTWSSFSEMNPYDLFKSVGVGVRIQLPMLGLMGVDFGWGLDDPTPNGFDSEPHGFELGFIMNRGF